MEDILAKGSDLTIAEALSTGVKTTAVGLSIVFGVLVILMIVLMLFKVIFYKNKSKPENKEVIVSKPEIASKPEPDDEELIAVITAAIAASLNTSTYNLKIKSYRKLEDKRPAWNRAGLEDTINSRF